MKRLKLTVADSTSLSKDQTLKIDWEKCCLCQGHKPEPLVCPANNPILKSRNAGYMTLGANLEKLKIFNYLLTSGFKVNDLDEGDSIQETLKNHSAKYHKHSCA